MLQRVVKGEGRTKILSKEGGKGGVEKARGGRMERNKESKSRQRTEEWGEEWGEEWRELLRTRGELR